MELGEKIKDLRVKKKFTLRDVSKRSGCSLGFLSQVERGLVSPTISSLRKIADALDTTIITFFHETPVIKDSIVVKKNNRAKFVNKSSKVIYELLRPQFSDTKLEALCMYIEPRASSGDKAHIHNGEEFFLVLKGAFKIEVNGKSYILEEGDSGVYKSSLPHKWSNPSNTNEAIIIWVNYPPTF